MSTKLLALELTEKQLKGLPDDATDKQIRDEIVGLLTAKAGGGMIVPAHSLKRIREITKRPVENPDEVVSIAEKSVRQNGDRLVFEWEVDPIYMATLGTLAERMDKTVNQVVQIMVDQMVARGLLFAIEPDDAHRVLFTHEQMKELQGLLGIENVTGHDISHALQNAALPQVF